MLTAPREMHLVLLLVVLPSVALLTTAADACRWPQSVMVGSLLLQVLVVVSAIFSKEAPGSIGGHWLPGLALSRGAVAVRGRAPGSRQNASWRLIQKASRTLGRCA